MKGNQVSDCPDILISLRPAYTQAILEGRKTVELRRRKVHAAVGTRVWLYSKTPTARIEGVAWIKHVHEGGLSDIWSEYSNQVGVSKGEFEDYFKGCRKGCAIVLVEARAISPAVDLKTVKSRLGGFHPPQFFKRLNSQEIAVLHDVASGHSHSARFALQIEDRYLETGIHPATSRRVSTKRV